MYIKWYIRWGWFLFYFVRERKEITISENQYFTGLFHSPILICWAYKNALSYFGLLQKNNWRNMGASPPQNEGTRAWGRLIVFTSGILSPWVFSYLCFYLLDPLIRIPSIFTLLSLLLSSQENFIRKFHTNQTKPMNFEQFQKYTSFH